MTQEELSLRLRRWRWRIGRALYKSARGDVPNEMRTNGELKLVGDVVRAMADGHLPPVALDVGANRGEWSREVLDQANRHGVTDMRLLAFEPVPGTAERLRTSIGHRKGVTLLDRALCERQGTARMAVSSAEGSSGGTNALVAATATGTTADATHDEIEVRLDTLAHIFDEFGIERAGVVKCDAEGFDPFVIDGAARLLAEGRIGVLQFEYNHRWVATRRFLKDVFDTVDGLPYIVCGLRPDGLERFDSWHYELESFFERNYVLVRDDLAKFLPIHTGTFDATNSYA